MNKHMLTVALARGGEVRHPAYSVALAKRRIRHAVELLWHGCGAPSAVICCHLRHSEALHHAHVIPSNRRQR